MKALSWLLKIAYVIWVTLITLAMLYVLLNPHFAEDYASDIVLSICTIMVASAVFIFGEHVFTYLKKRIDIYQNP